MNYEIHDLVINNLEAEEDIKYTLFQIRDAMVNADVSQEVIAYVLGGGFGRGEGSIKLVNNHYQTTNDYDIFAICTTDIDRNKMQELARKVEKKYQLQFFGIDIITLPLFEKLLKQKELSQSFFDFLTESKIIWTNDKYEKLNIIEKFEAFRSNAEDVAIQTSSAYNVLRTRMWCIIALADYKGGDLYDKIYVKEKDFFYFQQVKLATAIIDAVLIVEKRYQTPKFAFKIKHFQESAFSQKYDTSLVLQLVDDKLHNNNSYMLRKESIEKLNDLYCKCVRYVKNFDRKAYRQYKVTESLRYVYKKYVKKGKKSMWRLEDYKKIEKKNIKQLIQIQKRMRGMY